MPTRPRTSGPSPALAFFAFLILVTLAVSALAQELPREFDTTRELSKMKAERFERWGAAPAMPTPNQTEYDVHHYDIDIAMDPGTSTISGSVTMTAEVLSASMTQVEIDLDDDMSVSGAWSDGIAASYSHPGLIVTVVLDRTYTTGETFTVKVDYSGTPDGSYGAFGFSTRSGEPLIWSLSEPFGARSWWPCKDTPSDKADSVDIRIEVPSNLTVASNGLLQGVTDLGATRKWHWHESYPITTYLVSVAIHPYTQFSHWYHHAPGDSMEVQYYVYPDHYSSVQATYALTVPMIELFADLYGEYPFINEKYGHAEFPWGGGMEHQTISSMGGWSEYLIAHELAHMWWGDYVTCNDFHHIWMNEGFAVYSEALWSENEYGLATYKADMSAAKYFGSGTIYVPDTSDWNRIFHGGLTYNKASWVLHMLRGVVGDVVFFDIMDAYYQDVTHAYGTVTTEQFRDLCENVTGMDLDWFFHQWIYEEYYPQYSYGWASTPNGGQYDVNLTVDQTQTHYTYKMPIDITVEFAVGETTLVVWDSLTTQAFTLTVDAEPVALHFDRDEWILRTVEQQISNPSFDRGILVVNGVDFNTYGSEIWNAYVDSVFWGDNEISFWDCFNETGSGYPSNVPPPLGHGAVPADTLKQFSTVVWVGNNYNGDIAMWYDSPIQSYLDVGGNVLLMGRMGQDFLSGGLLSYMGLTWAESNYNTLGNCVSTYTGLTNMSLIGTQSYCAVFDTSVASSETKLLFAETASFGTTRGLGAWRAPAGGGSGRADGGNFVFISGRPYRYNHDHLRANVEYILEFILDEPYQVPTSAEDRTPTAFQLWQNYPNPFNPHTTIRFNVAQQGPVDLRVYDVAGRLVRTLIARELPAGAGTVDWDGTDNRGQRVASGVYFYRLTAIGKTATRKMVLLR